MTKTEIDQSTAPTAVMLAVLNFYDPLPYGYPLGFPGATCTVSPENPDRARLSIDRGDLRMHIEFWAEGWAPMRPAKPTLIQLAEDEAASRLGTLTLDKLASEEFEKLAKQLSARNVLWYGSGPAWNPLPEDGWLEIEYWFEKLPGAR